MVLDAPWPVRWELPVVQPSVFDFGEARLAVNSSLAFVWDQPSRGTIHVRAVDLKTGKIRWAAHVDTPGTPTIQASEHLVLLNLSGSSTVFSAATGQVLWRVNRSGKVPPCLAGDTLVTSPDAAVLEGKVLRAGQFRNWTWKMHPGQSLAQVIATPAGIAVTDNQQHLSSVSAVDGTVRWTIQLPPGAMLEGANEWFILLRSKSWSVLRSVNGQAVKVTLPPASTSFSQAEVKAHFFMEANSDRHSIKVVDLDAPGKEVEVPGFAVLEDAANADQAMIVSGLDVWNWRPTTGSLQKWNAFESVDQPHLVADKLLYFGDRGLVCMDATHVSPPPRLEPILRKSSLVARDLRDIVSLGHSNLPRLMQVAIDSPTKRGQLIPAICELARLQDTRAMFSFATRLGISQLTDRAAMGRWLLEKSDPAVVGDLALDLDRMTSNPSDHKRLVPLIALGTSAIVVSHKLSVLKDPFRDLEEKRTYFEQLAASPDETALAWIRATRISSRRLDAPTPGLSTTADEDGDGIPDAFDANPSVARQPVTDAERILAAAFEELTRFSREPKKGYEVDYGADVQPFELVGPAVPVYPIRPVDSDSDVRRILFKSKPAFVDKLHATIDVTVGGRPMASTGYRVWAEKIRGHWYVTRVLLTWQS